jgi:copper(I)-binding protein
MKISRLGVLTGVLMIGMSTILISTLIMSEGRGDAKDTRTALAITHTQEEVTSPLPSLNPARECVSCHGTNLEGDPNWETKLGDGSNPPPPLNDRGHASHHSDADLLTILIYGVNSSKESFMPGYQGFLRDDEQMALLDFIKSTWSEDEYGHQHNLAASVRQAWVAPAEQGANVEISLALDNPATYDTRLMLPATEVAERVEIVDSNGIVVKDTGLTALTLDQKLAPGGVHLRLVGLNRTLNVGDSFWLRLQLTGMGEILAEAKVTE